MDALTSVLTRLLTDAGLHQEVSAVRAVSGSGWTNQTHQVELADGQRFILRVYRWPHADQPDGLRRVAKERFLHQLLRLNGVPVPEVIAQIENEGQAAALLQYLPGELLGDLDPRLPEVERQQAWYAAGAALRRAHEIHYPSGTHGVIVGDEIQPFDAGSWGRFHLSSILEHAQQLIKQHSILLDIERLQKVLEAAVSELDDTPASLLHNDPHPWNVLVRQGESGWECSGWLDWEYSWVGDPDWDLVRMDLFRTRRIGPTPRAFFEGYGAVPADLSRSVYTLHIYLWMANDFLGGGRTLPPTYEAARAYLTHIDESIAELGRMTSPR
jgi:aminoglycoside phosphotransferase (APT) family kinase protein